MSWLAKWIRILFRIFVKYWIFNVFCRNFKKYHNKNPHWIF
jgi:hypothetical protein